MRMLNAVGVNHAGRNPLNTVGIRLVCFENVPQLRSYEANAIHCGDDVRECMLSIRPRPRQIGDVRPDARLDDTVFHLKAMAHPPRDLGCVVLRLRNNLEVDTPLTQPLPPPVIVVAAPVSCTNDHGAIETRMHKSP